MEWLIESLCDMDSEPDGCLTINELLGLGIEGSDVMVFVGHWDLIDETMEDGWFWEDLCVLGGLIEVINGKVTGAGVLCECDGADAVLSFLGGEYCSSMASEAGLPIDPRFIEDAWVTVKQLPPVDLAVTKMVCEPRPLVDQVVTFTITVTNNGPAAATGIALTDVMTSELSYLDHSASKGSYDDVSGVWTVGKLTVGATATLLLRATVVSDDPSENCVEVSAVDQSDWNSFNDGDCVVLNAAPTLDACINLRAGWNLISLPLIPDFPAVDTILAGIEANINTIQGVATYDALERDVPPGYGWFSNIPPLWDGDLDELADGAGYWLVMDDSDQLCFDGVEVELPPMTPPTYTVIDGWNLIGFKSVVPRKAGDYLAAIDGKYTMIYRFTGGVFSVVQASDNMVPGQGFWIAVVEPGEWTIYP
jgi:uncharacterized repeat protein (TIGR01451 family)